MKIEQIWSEYRGRLRAFLNSKISNPADVDDLLQEILIKTHNNLHTVKDESSVKAWLFQIANRTVIDFYRSTGRYAELSREELWYEDSELDVKGELSQCIEPFIRALPKDVAELLVSVDLQGKSQKAYAEELGISYTTLKSRIQKGRKDLRILFDGCCHFDLDKSGNLINFEPKSRRCKNC